MQPAGACGAYGVSAVLGQALAYKIGELKIRELRKYAEMKLETAFEIRAFHDSVLAGGSLPQNILEERIHAWVAI